MENQRISQIILDGQSAAHRSPQVEHERQVAIYDLLEDNYFCLVAPQEGPFHLHMSVLDGRVIFDVRNEGAQDVCRISIPSRSFRRIIRDYFLVCETYFAAIKTKAPSQIEAIDMGRRGLHNEGAEVLKERLSEHVDIDHPTARRLFTLVCVLQLKG